MRLSRTCAIILYDASMKLMRTYQVDNSSWNLIVLAEIEQSRTSLRTPRRVMVGDVCFLSSQIGMQILDIHGVSAEPELELFEPP